MTSVSLLSSTDHVMRGALVSIGSAWGAWEGLGVLAQSVPGLSDNVIMQVAEKGGGWVVLLIVLWFYRRDYKRLAEGEAERARQIVLMSEAHSAAQQSMAVALAANNELLRNALGDDDAPRRRNYDRPKEH